MSTRIPSRAPLLAILFAGCAASLPHPTTEDVAVASSKWPGTTHEELRAGRASYVAKCSGCHQLFLPSSRPPEAWPKLVEEMRVDAKVSADEATRITRYLVTVSSRGSTPTSE